jgi:transcription factor E2F7/8
LLASFSHRFPSSFLHLQATQVTSPLPVPSTKNRKEKSLGVLCRSFLELYKDAPPNRDNNGTVIEICQVAEHLGVKRRRIYDVINILESLDIVCRVKKNTYRWHGKDELPKFFAKLQYEGKKEEEMVAASVPAPAVETETKEEEGATTDDAAEATTDATAAEATPAAKRVASAKIKGMAQTCRKLIQSFLVSNRTEIGLTEAAEEVLGPLSPAEEANAVRAMKTKVRRMYDIANVLQSIGILQKENVGSTSLTNKPSFRWVYPTLPAEMSKFLNMTEVEAAEVAKKVEEAAKAATAAAEKVAAEAAKKTENPTVEV